jgi:SAM-dependent methyltransferase
MPAGELMATSERVPGRYDRLGVGYLQTRREDPRLVARIHAGLGNARSVVNVGAGPGAYEPRGLAVVAVEPSAVMIAQRPAGAAPAVRAAAEALPFGQQQFDAAMALWTIHHWADPGQGIAQLRRVARSALIVAASERLNQLWLTRDYFPAMTRARRPEIQPNRIAALLGGNVRIEPFPVPRDCLDGFAEAFWARPEAYLDSRIRAGMSAFRLLDDAEISLGLQQLQADLRSGAWEARHGNLRQLGEFDCGLRLIIATGIDAPT